MLEAELDLLNEVPLPGDLVEILSQSPNLDYALQTVPNEPSYVHTLEDTKTTKRRQTNRLSEAKRRNKFKNQFETLKAILVQTKQGKKLTQEEILDLAISKLQEYEVLAKRQILIASPLVLQKDAFSQVPDVDSVFQRVIEEESTNMMKFADNKYGIQYSSILMP